MHFSGPPRLEFSRGKLPGLLQWQGDDPFPSRASLEEFVVPITLISFIFLTFITADILKMRFNDLLTKASLWDRYLIYLIIWLAVSFVILMQFICFLKFHFCFAVTSWEFVTSFFGTFVLTARPLRRPLILEASTVLPVWNIYPALSMEKVNVCLTFLQPTYPHKLVYKSGKGIPKVAPYSCFLERMRYVWHYLKYF